MVSNASIYEHSKLGRGHTHLQWSLQGLGTVLTPSELPSRILILPCRLCVLVQHLQMFKERHALTQVEPSI